MKRKFKYVILSWLNYNCGTWFCESQSERVVRDWLNDNGIDYACQVRMFGYRVDFLVTTEDDQYIIEVDGPHHKTIASKDAVRDAILRGNGYRIIRLQASGLWEDREHELSKLEFLK